MNKRVNNDKKKTTSSLATSLRRGNVLKNSMYGLPALKDKFEVGQTYAVVLLKVFNEVEEVDDIRIGLSYTRDCSYDVFGCSKVNLTNYQFDANGAPYDAGPLVRRQTAVQILHKAKMMQTIASAIREKEADMAQRGKKLTEGEKGVTANEINIRFLGKKGEDGAKSILATEREIMGNARVVVYYYGVAFPLDGAQYPDFSKRIDGYFTLRSACQKNLDSAVENEQTMAIDKDFFFLNLQCQASETGNKKGKTITYAAVAKDSALNVRPGFEDIRADIKSTLVAMDSDKLLTGIRELKTAKSDTEAAAILDTYLANTTAFGYLQPDNLTEYQAAYAVVFGLVDQEMLVYQDIRQKAESMMEQVLERKAKEDKLAEGDGLDNLVDEADLEVKKAAAVKTGDPEGDDVNDEDNPW